MTPPPLIQDDADTLDDLVARAVVCELKDAIKSRGGASLCASAGRTWRGVYRQLAEAHSDRVEWPRVRLIQMDDYVGIAADHPFSFAAQIRRELVQPLQIEVFRTFGDAGVIDSASAARFEATLGDPIDLVLHGVGRNGHLGFNEPGSSQSSLARLVDLHRDTLEDNFRNDEDRALYGQGFTLGMKTLLSARRSFVLVKGPSKTTALHRLMHGPADDDWPVSRLAKATGLLVFADRAAWPATPNRQAPCPAPETLREAAPGSGVS